MEILTVTPSIATALELVPKKKREELGLSTVTSGVQEASNTDGDTISYAQLERLSKYLTSDEVAGDSIDLKVKYSLHCLLRGTRVVKRPPPPNDDSKKPQEYLASKAQLLAQQEQKQYHDLLRGHSPATTRHSPQPIFAQTTAGNGKANPWEEDEDPLSVSLVLNIFISVIFTGFAVYWAISSFRVPAFLLSFLSKKETGALYPGSPTSLPARVFLSILAAIFIGVAEVIVYASYWRQVKAAKTKEGKVAEKRTIVKESPPKLATEKPSKVTQIDEATSIKIWGRGVNGGCRKRVREQWERKKATEKPEQRDR